MTSMAQEKKTPDWEKKTYDWSINRPSVKDEMREAVNEAINPALKNSHPSANEEPASENREPLSQLRFGEDVKILLIGSPDKRLICHHLGINSVKDIKNSSFTEVALLGMLHQENIKRFMESRGYVYAGEMDFDPHGNPIVCSKHRWNLKGGEISFTRTGFMFYDAPTNKKEDNLVFYAFVDLVAGIAGVVCYARSEPFARRVITELNEYTKTTNALRGAKLRDISIAGGSFGEIENRKFINWDTFFYPSGVKKVFDLEIFNFLRNPDKYNKLGINKRGVLMHGPPGTGKTSIGYIICNELVDQTVIWITPELVHSGGNPLKMFYKFADYVSPVAVVLEDIDLFCEDRDERTDSKSLGSLMNILDGVNSIRNCVTIAMTNRLELIEKALSNRPGRFDRVIAIPALSDELRFAMLRDRLADCQVEESTIRFLVEQSNARTGAEIQEVVNSLNIWFIDNDQLEDRVITIDIAEDVLSTLSQYSVAYKKRKGGVGFAAEQEA